MGSIQDDIDTALEHAALAIAALEASDDQRDIMRQTVAINRANAESLTSIAHSLAVLARLEADKHAEKGGGDDARS